MQTKAWHPIPTEVLKAAREARGWSYETTARALGISAKTWERYEKAGKVPIDIVGNVIATLALDVEHPIAARLRLRVDDPSGAAPPSTAEILTIVRQTADVVGQLVVALRVLSDRLDDRPLDVASASPRSRGELAQPL